MPGSPGIIHRIKHIEKAEGTAPLAFVVIKAGVLDGALTVPGALEIPGPNFPAGMTDRAPGVQRPVFAIDLVPVNQKWALPAAAPAAQTNAEVLGVFLNGFQNSADGHIVIADAAAIPSAVCKKELGISIYHLSFAPEYREGMPVHFKKVLGGSQSIHNRLLNGLADHLCVGGIDAAVIVQIEAGQYPDGAGEGIHRYGIFPGVRLATGIVAAKDQRIDVRLRLNLILACPHHGNNPLVGEAGSHEEIVGVVVAVLDIKNNFIYHRDLLAELKTQAHAESITLKKYFPPVIDFSGMNVFYTEARQSVLPSA